VDEGLKPLSRRDNGRLAATEAELAAAHLRGIACRDDRARRFSAGVEISGFEDK
jgi:hypothetical protein